MSILPVILVLLAQAEEPRPERVVLTGTVVGPDGRPAAGPEVVLTHDAPPVSALTRTTGAVLRPPAVLQTRRTDAEGRFRVELPEDDAAIRRLRVPVSLWAFGPGGALAMRPIPDDWPADGEPVRLALARPETVRFRVLDPEERPAAGVRLVPRGIPPAREARPGGG